MNWGIIPELFYDLIARVVPGAMLLVLGVLVVCGVYPGIVGLLELNKEAPLAAFSLTLLFSYFVSLFIQPLASTTMRHMPWLRKQQGQEEDIHISYQQLLSSVKECYMSAKPNYRGDDIADFIVLGSIRRAMPDEGLRILKIQAERKLSEVLSIGLLLLLALDVVWLFINSWLLDNLLLLLLLIGSIATLLKWKISLDKEYERSLCSLWYLLKGEPGSAGRAHYDSPEST